MKTAFITGVTGQDGSYLAELLVEKGYEVHGLLRRSSFSNAGRIDHLTSRQPETSGSLHLHHGDLTDGTSLQRLVEKIRPDEVYHLAAQSQVGVALEVPEYTAEVNAVGTLRLLNAIQNAGIKPRFFHASTSDLYGQSQEVPQTERTPFHPRGPYAIAKLFAHWSVVNYRELHDFHASNGILFSHDSPRRSEWFVSRKITLGAARIKAGKQDRIVLGNLDTRREWGYAREYAEAMWRMLQQESPGDHVVATGKPHAIREFVQAVFEELGMEISWQGKGIGERAIANATGNTVVEVSPEYFRPTDVTILTGDPSQTDRNVGWKAQTSFRDLVRLMVKADLEFITGKQHIRT